MEYEVDNDTNHRWCAWNGPKFSKNENGNIENQNQMDHTY